MNTKNLRLFIKEEFNFKNIFTGRFFKILFIKNNQNNGYQTRSFANKVLKISKPDKYSFVYKNPYYNGYYIYKENHIKNNYKHIKDLQNIQSKYFGKIYMNMIWQNTNVFNISYNLDNICKNYNINIHDNNEVLIEEIKNEIKIFIQGK